VKTHYLVAAIIPAIIVTASISGFVWAQKQARIVVDGHAVEVWTQAADVGALLAQSHIAVNPGDVVIPSTTSPVTRGLIVTVRHATRVVVSVAGRASSLAVVGDTVADALVAAGIDPVANPTVTPALSAKLVSGMTISVPRVFARMTPETVLLPFGRRVVDDPELPRGMRQIVSKGSVGSALRIYRSYVANGVEGTRTLAAVRTVAPAVDEVVAIGTGTRSGHYTAIVASARVLARTTDAEPPPPGVGRKMRLEATGYAPGEPGVDHCCATGAYATHGVIAVDPRVIPLGTHVYVPGYGYAIAADTGGAIKGDHIDLCFDTIGETEQWGRRTVTIVVLD
jgi:uncharacterized protein YabE (DUF348 family)/3D (Asp-Asp-Asp) domain-containing protein